MKKLPLQDQRHLDAAEGWLGLGNFLAANEELEQISPGLRAHPQVLELRYQIYSQVGKWDLAAEVAKEMSEMLPDNPWGHFHLAYALHELKKTQEAYDCLIPVIERFPNEWLMLFNLACYSCQLGKMKEAMQCLEKAGDLASKKDIRLMALDDADLEPLWTKIGEI